MSEGAGVVVLEEMTFAQRRKAPLLAELLGYGCTANAYRITDSPPDGEMEMEAMRNTLNDAGVEKEEIDYINAHGTSTKQNDLSETVAIKSLFGERAYEIPVSSNKAQIGHTICAAGVIGSIFTILSIKEGILPPTMNYQNVDPQCDLDYVPNESRSQAVSKALVNSFAFGGHNASLLFGKIPA